MELSVLIQQTAGNGFRAWCGEPIPATAEGATREEALDKLRAALESKTRGVEVVFRLTYRPKPHIRPVWPDGPDSLVTGSQASLRHGKQPTALRPSGMSLSRGNREPLPLRYRHVFTLPST